MLTINDLRGRRKYLNAVERQEFLAAAERFPQDITLFCRTLAYTGLRLSEALSVTPENIDLSELVLTVRSLKKRNTTTYRSIPIPHNLTVDLLNHQQGADLATGDRFWPWCRTTGWKYVKNVMCAANIGSGPHMSPKGLRHGFGVAAIQAGVPLNLVQRWLGHRDISTTAIYANVVGPEERLFASKMWAATDSVSLNNHSV